MVVAAKEKQNTKEKTHEMNFRIRANAVKANIEMRTGKKITWKDGIAALYHILYFNISANYFYGFLFIFIILIIFMKNWSLP